MKGLNSQFLAVLLIGFYFASPFIYSFRLPVNHVKPLKLISANYKYSLYQPAVLSSGRKNLPLFYSSAKETADQPIFLSSSSPTIDNPQPTTHSNPLFQSIQNVINWPKQQINRFQHFFATQLPMFRYLWPKDNPSIRVYLVLSMIFMYIGNWFNLKVPFILQNAVDTITKINLNNQNTPAELLWEILKPIQWGFVFYGLTRAVAVICAEIKASFFAHVSQTVLKQFAYQIFVHLHALDSAFHLTTPSGVISVAYVRAVRGFQTMLLEIVFSIAPTLLDLAMVSSILYKRFGFVFSSITLTTFMLYFIFTIWMTQWRVKIRQDLVDVDNLRNGFLIDSILNHEIVKLFSNEKREISRFDSYLGKIKKLSIDCTYLIALLNIGQALLFSGGLTVSLLLALREVTRGRMTIGDVIAVNAMLLQLAIPFNNMGYTCKKPLYYHFLFLISSILFLFVPPCFSHSFRSRTPTSTGRHGIHQESPRRKTAGDQRLAGRRFFGRSFSSPRTEFHRVPQRVFPLLFLGGGGEATQRRGRRGRDGGRDSLGLERSLFLDRTRAEHRFGRSVRIR
jgi:hypothetical protein